MGIKDTCNRILSVVIPPKTAEDDEGQKESYFIPGALVTTLFFLWGFSYGLLDTLNKHFQNVLGISKQSKLGCTIVYHREINLVLFSSYNTDDLYASGLFWCILCHQSHVSEG